MNPVEDFNQFIVDLMDSEKIPREAAICGAQRYALDTAKDYDERASFEYKEGRYLSGEKLADLAKEYRRLVFAKKEGNA
jgi:hypothetical protein